MSQILAATAALHALAGVHAAAQRAAYLAGVQPPNPGPIQVPGLSGPVDIILGWLKWGALIAGSIGLSLCAFKMMVGHRSRSSMAADGASSIVWVLAGLSLAAVGAGIVGTFL
jgi:hypothetical protein